MKRVFILLVAIVAIPLVSAQFFGYGYLPPPSQWLENEYLTFTLFFAIFFATIHLSLSRVFSGNPMPPMIIAAALAFLISASIQKNWVFLERPVMFWAMSLIGVLIVLAILRMFGGGMNIGGILMLVGVIIMIWPFAKSALPSQVMLSIPEGVMGFFDTTSAWVWPILILFIIIQILALFPIPGLRQLRMYRLWGRHRAVERGRAPWLE